MENAKKTYSRFGFSYMVPYFGYLLIMLIVTVLIIQISGAKGLGGDGYMLLNYAVRVVFLYPLMYLCIRKIPKFEMEKKKLGAGGFVACVCIAYTIMIILNYIGITLNTLIGEITGQGTVNPIIDAMDNSSPIVRIVLVVIIAPICEELLFRKFLIDRIVNYGEVTAMLLSGFMFALYHGNMAQFMYAFGLGIFFAFVYIRTGNIGYTIGLHMIINGVTTFLLNIIMRGISINEFMEVYSSGDEAAITSFFMEHPEVILGLGLFLIFIIIMFLSGCILIIALRKKFVFVHHPEEIEKGKRFSTAILNGGMMFFIVFWIYMIITVQMGFSLFDYLVSSICKMF